ncbi:MAG TPA: Nif3-like dinuclear metal center hexameric protein [Firmicutes bacterium]|nr:Nif3-like dinuclear metal center hexameric protein [Bacillota bacterium]
MKVSDIYQWMDQAAPFSLQDSFDNAGLLAGNPDAEVTGCLLALDVTDALITEAVDKGFNLLLTHHPVIFQPLKSVLENSISYKIIENKLNVISAHTNFDRAANGLNDILACRIGLQEVDLLDPNAGLEGYGRIGVLPEAMQPAAFAAHVRDRLGASGVRFCAGTRPVRKVAVVSGAGGEFYPRALSAGADAFVTGETRHHEELDMARRGLTLVTAGHFETEHIFADPLAACLRAAFPEGIFEEAQANLPVMQIL